MNTEKTYISVLTDTFIPEILRETYPKFELFIKYYLEHLEQEGEIYQVLSDFLHYIDVDKLTSGEEDILLAKMNQYLVNFPDHLISTIQLKKLIKNAKDFNSIIGTEKSFDFLFRLLEYNGVTFYYPCNDIMVLNKPGHLLSGPIVDDTDPYYYEEYTIKRIHDNNYFAYYTYEIQSENYDFIELKNTIEKVLHTAGIKLFYKRILNDIVSDAWTSSTNESNELI